MKKLIAIILFALMLTALVSCVAKNDSNTQTAAPSESKTETPASESESETEPEPEDDRPIGEQVESFLDEGMCITHGKFDVMFNYTGDSFTLENLTNLIKKAAGLRSDCTVEIDEADFEYLAEEYQGSGDGGGGAGNGYVWPSPIVVTFSDPSTGETVEEEISFSIRKCLPSQELYPNGVLGTCPEDSDPTLKAAYKELNTVATSEENPAYTGYDGEYTAEAVEAFFRDLTGLTDADAYAFYLVGFDPETRGEPFFAIFAANSAPAGHFDPVWIETAFQ